MKRVSYWDIEDEVTICPYCGSEQYSALGCCGESSDHFETAYVYQGETYTADEIEIYKPLFETLYYETRLRLRKRYWRLKKEQSRRFLRKCYDESFWHKNKNYKSPILKLRQFTGFQWSKLDCFILRQLHDFPLYYTSPDELKRLRKEHVKNLVKAWSQNEMIGVNLVPKVSDSERDIALAELNASE